MLSQILSLMIVSHLISAAPIPALITRYHTAAAVTTTQTYVTGTTTVYLPPVELFISNGVSYTFTLCSEQWNTYPVTTTKIYNNNQQIQLAPATTTQQTTSSTTPAAVPETTQQSTTPQETAQAVPTTSQTTPAPTTSQATPAPTTSQTTPEPTTSAAPSTTESQTSQTTPEQNTPQTSSIDQTTSSSTSSAAPTTAQTSSTAQTSTAQTSTAQTTTAQTTTAQTSTAQTTTAQTTVSTQYTSQTSSLTTSTSTNGGGIAAPTAIVYSPYQDDRSCKDVSTINSDLELIFSKGIKKIRVYGTDCNNFLGILPKCAQLGIKVNQGVWFTPSGGTSSIDLSVADIISYGQASGWDVFDFITIGNEAVNDGYLSASDLISKISSVKSQLRSSGYNGQVTTSEPPVSFERHPELCTSSDIDIVGINPHSYFDASIDASQAGSFIMLQKLIVEGICGSKLVLITETGYPSQGNANGQNQPSAENQKIAIQSIIDQTGSDCTILTTYNDFWKLPGPYGIEQYFGTITLFD